MPSISTTINLELLIKLLKLTTSSNDGEALSAMRKANLQIEKVGGDWETLLRGKVTILADPFVHVAAPTPPRANWTPPTAAPPPPPKPQPAPKQWPPQQPFQTTARKPRARTNWSGITANSTDL